MEEAIMRGVLLVPQPRSITKEIWLYHLKYTLGYVVYSPVRLHCFPHLPTDSTLTPPPGLGSIIFGYDLGVIAGVLPAPDFIVRTLKVCQ